MPVSRYSAGCAGLAVVLALLASPARAEAPERLNLRSDSACPRPEEVARQLAPLMPETELATDTATGSEATPETVTVRDTPAGLRVEASGAEKEFREVPDDCSERARMVAVFVHLKYAPLLVGESALSTSSEPLSSPPKTAATPTEPAPASASTRAPKVTAGKQPEASSLVRSGASASDWSASLAIAALTTLDARSLDRSAVYGVSARGWIGDEWALAFGLSVLLPSKHELISDAAPEDAVLRVWRTPADVALRHQRRWGSASVYGELGLELALLLVSRLTAPGQVYRLEWGPRAAFGIGHDFGRGFTLGASLFATFVPIPYEFRLEPRQSLGKSPAAWGGIALGLWF